MESRASERFLRNPPEALVVTIVCGINRNFVFLGKS
jgi:hypothetical protein